MRLSEILRKWPMLEQERQERAKKRAIEAMIECVADNGGEYSFKTVKGKVQDVHYTKR